MVDRALFTSDSDEWATPRDLFDVLNQEFRFTLDVAATAENSKCERYFTKEDDGLRRSWAGEVCWLNPPYSRVGDWMMKAHTQAGLGRAIVVCLIPSRTDTAYWHRFVMEADEIRFIRGRLKFGQSSNSAPFPSAIVIFDPKGAVTRGRSRTPLVVGWDYRKAAATQLPLVAS